MKRSGPPARHTPLRATKPLERHTELRRTTSVKTGPSGVKGRSAGGGASDPARGLARSSGSRSRFLRDPAAVIEARSGRGCEIQLEGCYGLASQKSHRITQKAGGRHGAAKERSDRPSNALDACWWCHLVITERPWLVDAKANGWVLEEWQEPTQVPVLYRGEPMYLTDSGLVVSFEEAGA